MARISFVGVGKLGFPCALSAARHHDVVGYDVYPQAKDCLASRSYPHREVKVEEYLQDTTFRMVDTLDEAVAHGEVIFVAVQTPHQTEYEGVTRMPEDRADFDYTFLKDAIQAVAESAKKLQKKIVVCVISTVLPGTSEREIYPLLNEYTVYAYNPFFIAMGTTCVDYEKPEFHLLGVDDREEKEGRAAADLVKAVYAPITGRPVAEMSVKSAEMCKVHYNSVITQKIVLANTLMEICEKVGANCDDITDALKLATDRIISPKYMRGGMGDAGGCHPRDNIALSWLSNKLGLSYNLYDNMMRTREAQTEWIGNLVVEHALESKLPIVVLGKAFKAGTNLTVGSCATLLVNIMKEQVIWKDVNQMEQWDPHIDQPRTFTAPAVFVVATDHKEFYEMNFPEGSIIIDPWGKMRDQSGRTVKRVGRR